MTEPVLPPTAPPTAAPATPPSAPPSALFKSPAIAGSAVAPVNAATTRAGAIFFHIPVFFLVRNSGYRSPLGTTI
ncbi:hypothetical protein P355_1361 [Burkholderia cenocepacia KC-01]|nr:hypothetical protein P355_1361 [Burkholderia cenocepacia KC-01]